MPARSCFDVADLVSFRNDRGHYPDDAVVAAENARGLNGCGTPGKQRGYVMPDNRLYRFGRDHWANRRRSFLFTLGSALLGHWLSYTEGPAEPSLLLQLYALAGLLVGTIGGVPYVMVRAFPA
jgi:hypothetical protein